MIVMKYILTFGAENVCLYLLPNLLTNQAEFYNYEMHSVGQECVLNG